MLYFNNKKYYISLICNVLTVSLLVFFMGCAQPTSPTGGPKDIAPPRALHFVPENEQSNFSAQKISITFDEYLTLDNASEQVIFSPILHPKPKIQIKGKTLIIDFNGCTLQPQTTYSIYFGTAIKDLNEGNVLENFYYVFSTGEYVDSLSISGFVKNAFDLKPSDKAFVMLYTCDNDTIPCDSLPYYVQPRYIAQTKSDGSFLLRNLADKAYKVFVLNDENRNFLYDFGEKIAFSDSLIRPKVISQLFHNHEIDTLSIRDSLLTTETDNLHADSHQHASGYTFFMFQERDTIPQILESKAFDSTHWQAVFSSPAKNVTFSALAPSNKNIPNTMPWNIEFWSKERDSVTIWFPFFKNDSVKLMVYQEEKILDTVAFALIMGEKSKNKNMQRREEIVGEKQEIKKPTVSISSNLSGKISFFANLELRFGAPIDEGNLDRALFVVNNDTVTMPKFNFDERFFMKAKMENYHFKERTSYKMIIPQGAFTDIYGYQNDSALISFSTDEIENYGNLKVDIFIPDNTPPVIIQLLSDKEVLMKQMVIEKNQRVDFGMLKLSQVKLKAICDTNRNGKWDSGNYSQNIQPEKVVYFDKTIEIRANWDIEEVWKIYF